MKIRFWGATEEVTGSMTLVEVNGRIGVVDCGLYQGDHTAQDKNIAPLPIAANAIESIVVTHAHLDHSGKLPYLVKNGFKGPIICTRETAELLKIILLNSASLNESKHDSLYGKEDVKNTLELVTCLTWDESFIFLGVNAKLVPAGHILGASSLVIDGEKRVVFSGDLGRSDDFLLAAPAQCPPSDIVVMESTYGGKLRQGNIQEDMLKFIKKIRTGNTVGIIASFALARGQTLITLIAGIFKEHPELKVPLYFDSPMMKEVNAIYKKHSDLTNLPWDMFFALEHADSLDYAREWETVSRKSGPLIIISSSGMVTGGRIFRSLANWQTDPKAILFLVGYQGENTQGRLLLEGHRIIKDNAGNEINWHGEVFSSEAFSSHADQAELVNWVKDSGAQKIFLIHGEETSKANLMTKLKGIISAEVIIPKMKDTFDFTELGDK